jgi:hypothetical protein
MLIDNYFALKMLGDEATTVTDLSPSNFTNSTLGSTAPRTATQRAVAQSTIQAIKGKYLFFIYRPFPCSTLS